jgi:hypothetical protein
VLSIEEEAVIVAFRRHTLLPLDDCLYALQPTIPQSLTGRSRGGITASCKGTAKQAPGLTLDATLVRMGDS